MGNVIKLSDIPGTWEQIFVARSISSTMNVYRDKHTGRMEFILINDDGEAVSIFLSEDDSDTLSDVIKNFVPKRSA